MIILFLSNFYKILNFHNIVGNGKQKWKKSNSLI